MRNSQHILVGLMAGAALSMAAGSALAQGTLGWSFSSVGVGSCTSSIGCSPTGTPAVYAQQAVDQGFNYNSAASASDPLRGSGSASAGVGSTFLALPELKSMVDGNPDTGGAFSWNFAFTQGVIGYLWEGPTTEIALNTFVGTLDFDHSGGYYSYANGSLALLYNDVEDISVGSLWAQDNGSGGFRTDCSSAGAGGIATTGTVFTQGTNIQTFAAQQCGGAFTLTQGETFYLWARLETFTAGNGTVDASHTFTIDFAADVAPELQQLIVENSTQVEGGPGIAVPEPSIWALMIAGFGGVGVAVRRRRSVAA